MKFARVDENQREIVKFLREKNVSVAILSSLGKGIPDIICGYKGKNILLELKDGNKFPSEQALTAEQKIWHYDWKGQVAVVNSAESAWAEIQKLTKD